MKTLTPILAASALLALAACDTGTGKVSSETCDNARRAVALADAAIVSYEAARPDAPLPRALTDTLAEAKAALPAFCPAPVTVVVDAGAGTVVGD